MAKYLVYGVVEGDFEVEVEADSPGAAEDLVWEGKVDLQKAIGEFVVVQTGVEGEDEGDE